MFQLARMPARLPGELRAVIVMNRPERTHHGDIISAFADMLEPIANDKPALAVGAEVCLQRHDRLAISMRWIAADNILSLVLQHTGVRRVRDGLARILVELG